jgi:hypothetical protein
VACRKEAYKAQFWPSLIDIYQPYGPLLQYGVAIKLFAYDTKSYTVLQDDSVSSVELQSCLDAIHYCVLPQTNAWTC